MTIIGYMTQIDTLVGLHFGKLHGLVGEAELGSESTVISALTEICPDWWKQPSNKVWACGQ